MEKFAISQAEYVVSLSGLSMQDYKSLRVAVDFCHPGEHTHTHTHAHTHAHTHTQTELVTGTPIYRKGKYDRKKLKKHPSII